jgi:hypothetical protein
MEGSSLALNLNTEFLPPAVAFICRADEPDSTAKERPAAYVQSGKQHAGM